MLKREEIAATALLCLLGVLFSAPAISYTHAFFKIQKCRLLNPNKRLTSCLPKGEAEARNFMMGHLLEICGIIFGNSVRNHSPSWLTLPQPWNNRKPSKSCLLDNQHYCNHHLIGDHWWNTLHSHYPLSCTQNVTGTCFGDKIPVLIRNRVWKTRIHETEFLQWNWAVLARCKSAILFFLLLSLVFFPWMQYLTS